MKKSLLVAGLLQLLSLAGCVAAQPPTDTGDPVVATPTSPTSPTPPTPPTSPTSPTPPSSPAGSDTAALAYNPDMQPLFRSDCVICHGASRADGNYRMTTYAQVMTLVRPGSASSTLVAVAQPGGSMYRYWSGSSATRVAKAAQVRAWVVNDNAQENR